MLHHDMLTNRGFAYGDGFFTTMGVYHGGILWLTYHLKRLASHAEALQFDLDTDNITQQLHHHAETINEGMIKLIIVRKEQPTRGYGFVNGSVDIIIHPKPMSMPAYHQSFPHVQLQDTPPNFPVQPTGEAVLLSNKISCLPPSQLGLKSLNRLDNVMVAGELERIKQRNTALYNTTDIIKITDNQHITTTNNAHINIVEGLVSDVSDSFGEPTNWVEGTMSNVFYQLQCNVADTDKPFDEQSHEQSDKQWYTPPLDRSGVHGVMRHVIIDSLKRDKRAVIERRLTTEDLLNVSAMFFCNSVKGIIPINGLHLLTGKKLSFLWNGV